MNAPETILREAPLISASRLLAERGFFGILWVDKTLHVLARYGHLVDFVTIGAPLTDTVLPFAALENELRALQRKPKTVLDIPSVTIITKQDRTPRLNLAALWSNSERCYLVLASRAVVSSDLEVELNRQIRARLIAEADVMAKSKELQRANRELERVNTDLEQFASIISHDLKAPMRELRFLAGETEDLLSNGNLEKAMLKLVAMREQSQRMSQMLTALLNYATAGRKADAFEEIDTGTLVAVVSNGLQRGPGLAVKIEGEWPTLTTLAPLLDLVLRNLIDNALTHHDRETGTISVSAINEPDTLVITVADDGPGVPRKDHDAIFLPFRTLDDISAKGSGMGLALVSKALTAVGGRIEVLSDAPKSRGTSFRVHWPKFIAAD